jgi:ferredoxin
MIEILGGTPRVICRVCGDKGTAGNMSPAALQWSIRLDNPPPLTDEEKEVKATLRLEKDAQGLDSDPPETLIQLLTGEGWEVQGECTIDATCPACVKAIDEHTQLTLQTQAELEARRIAQEELALQAQVAQEQEQARLATMQLQVDYPEDLHDTDPLIPLADPLPGEKREGE